MAGSIMKPNGKIYRYYRCYNYTQKGPEACKSGAGIRADGLEKMILRCLSRLKLNPVKLRQYEKEQCMRERAEVEPLKREVVRLETALTKIAHRQDKIMLAYEEGFYPGKVMKERQAQAMKDREKVETDLEEARAGFGISLSISVLKFQPGW